MLQGQDAEGFLAAGSKFSCLVGGGIDSGDRFYLFTVDALPAGRGW